MQPGSPRLVPALKERLFSTTMWRWTLFPLVTTWSLRALSIPNHLLLDIQSVIGTIGVLFGIPRHLKPRDWAPSDMAQLKIEGHVLHQFSPFAIFSVLLTWRSGSRAGKLVCMTHRLLDTK